LFATHCFVFATQSFRDTSDETAGWSSIGDRRAAAAAAGAERCARHRARVVLAQHKRRGCHCPRQPDAVRYGNKQGATMTFLADAVGTGRCQIVERCTVRRTGAQHEG
jgi:hypothetical protein